MVEAHPSRHPSEVHQVQIGQMTILIPIKKVPKKEYSMNKPSYLDEIVIVEYITSIYEWRKNRNKTKLKRKIIPDYICVGDIVMYVDKGPYVPSYGFQIHWHGPYVVRDVSQNFVYVSHSSREMLSSHVPWQRLRHHAPDSHPI